MKKIKPRLMLVLSLLVFVCEFHHVAHAQLSAEDTLVSKNPKPSVLPLWKYPVMIDGETDYDPSLRPQEWFNSESNVPVSKLGEITNLGAKPRMVAFGGGLTAGVSNGGLYRESQQFAYPNLVAHQMGISDFESPLFSEEQANGTGFYKRSDFNAKYPRWKRVVNKMDTMKSASEYPLVFSPYEGMNSNFAVPNGSTASLYYPYCPECDFQPYVSRFSSFKADNLRFVIDDIKAEQPYDFVIIEDFIDRWINGLRTTPQLSPYSLCFNGSIFNSGEITDYAINSVLEANQKGIIFTIPHYKHLAYMNWYTTEELRKKASSIKISYARNNELVDLDIEQPFYLIPSPEVDELYRNLSTGGEVNTTLEDIHVIDYSEIVLSDPEKYYNPKIREFAKKKNLAVVDLYLIYEKIHSGNYAAEGDYRIDGGVHGNFFSSDGIYPTQIGQAVVANEVIKAINKTYSAQIPLIDLGKFAKTVGIE